MNERLPMEHEIRKRKFKQVTNDADRAELERHYSFVPDEDKAGATWQDRMVRNYHSHLYKEYALADLTRPGKIGLRWRTQREVQIGKGERTCGNKHCPSYQQDVSPDPRFLKAYLQKTPPQSEQGEQELLTALPYGLGLDPYEVPFKYQEHGATKQELVKLSLCLRCAPLIFRRKTVAGQEDISLQARAARSRFGVAPVDDEFQSTDDNSDASKSSASKARRRRRKKKHKKRKRRRRDEGEA